MQQGDVSDFPKETDFSSALRLRWGFPCGLILHEGSRKKWADTYRKGEEEGPRAGCREAVSHEPGRLVLRAGEEPLVAKRLQLKPGDCNGQG